MLVNAQPLLTRKHNLGTFNNSGSGSQATVSYHGARCKVESQAIREAGFPWRRSGRQRESSGRPYLCVGTQSVLNFAASMEKPGDELTSEGWLLMSTKPHGFWPGMKKAKILCFYSPFVFFFCPRQFATVYRARDKTTDTIVAIKKVIHVHTFKRFLFFQ